MAFANLYDSNFRAFCLHVQIKCKGTGKFRVIAEAYDKRNTKYADREIEINATDNKQRTIRLSFPVSPKQLFIGVLNSQNYKDDSFEVVLMEGELRSYNIEMSGQTKRFVAMAENFVQRCGYESATENGRAFKDNNKEFTIRYLNVITNRLTGVAMNTPARIGNETGIIEVAKCKFDKYTIPMRMIILLHEFSHKYRNPKIGLEIWNEKGADINALYIYLGLGFSKCDAVAVFMKVFLGAQTEGNRNRARLLMDYIKRFEQGEFAQRV